MEFESIAPGDVIRVTFPDESTRLVNVTWNGAKNKAIIGDVSHDAVGKNGYRPDVTIPYASIASFVFVFIKKLQPKRTANRGQLLKTQNSLSGRVNGYRFR